MKINRIVDNLKYWWYLHVNKKQCLCGGGIYTMFFQFGEDDYSYEVKCSKCGFLYGED